MANILQISDGRKLHDRLLKKESVSPLEVIRNEYNRFSYNVVRRPEGQCLGNLSYSNLNYDVKTRHLYENGNDVTLWSFLQKEVQFKT